LADRRAEALPESLIWAIVAVFVVGMGTIIGLMAMLKQLLDLGQGIVIAFGLLGFALMIAVESVFIYLLLSRRRTAAKEVGEGERPSARARKKTPGAGATGGRKDVCLSRAVPHPRSVRARGDSHFGVDSVA